MSIDSNNVYKTVDTWRPDTGAIAAVGLSVALALGCTAAERDGNGEVTSGTSSGGGAASAGQGAGAAAGNGETAGVGAESGAAATAAAGGSTMPEQTAGGLSDQTGGAGASNLGGAGAGQGLDAGAGSAGSPAMNVAGEGAMSGASGVAGGSAAAGSGAVAGSAGSAGAGAEDMGGAGGDAGTELPVDAGPLVSDECKTLAADWVGRMTVEQKVGQMLHVNLSANASLPFPEVGAVLANATVYPGDASTPEWWDFIDGVHAQGQHPADGIPVLFGLDAVHGMSKSSDAIIFPHNIGLGATWDGDLVEQVGRATAIEALAAGADWTYGPSVAAALDERWGRTYECFSESAELAGELGARSVLGLQSAGLIEGSSVRLLATAKHYAGDGAGEWGTAGPMGLDRGDSTLSNEEFRKHAVEQYVPTIQAGVGSVTVSFGSHQGVRLHESSYWVTDVFREELGFEGIVLSDYDGVHDLEGDIEQRYATAINAGLDMLMEDRFSSQAPGALAAAVNSGAIPMERVDDAVSRILGVKCAFGRFEDYGAQYPGQALRSQVGSQAHRDLAREAVQKSIVVLKNEGALPLAKGSSEVWVVGGDANNLKKQFGGWTIGWEGLPDGETAVGTSLVDGIRQVHGADQTVFVTNQTAPNTADSIVLVLAEDTYAEGNGDSNNLGLTTAELQLLEYYAGFDVPLTVVLVTGRPRIITDQLDLAEAWVVAWLPGTAGEGLADVLFGDVSPTGQLSFSWPASMEQIPINEWDADYDTDPPLFGMGFGLTY